MDVESGPEDAVLGNHKVVTEFSPDRDDRIEAVAAVDIDRRVDRVLNEVAPRSAGDVGACSLRVL